MLYHWLKPIQSTYSLIHCFDCDTKREKNPKERNQRREGDRERKKTAPRVRWALITFEHNFCYIHSTASEALFSVYLGHVFQIMEHLFPTLEILKSIRSALGFFFLPLSSFRFAQYLSGINPNIIAKGHTPNKKYVFMQFWWYFIFFHFSSFFLVALFNVNNAKCYPCNYCCQQMQTILLKLIKNVKMLVDLFPDFGQ